MTTAAALFVAFSLGLVAARRLWPPVPSVLPPRRSRAELVAEGVSRLAIEISAAAVEQMIEEEDARLRQFAYAQMIERPPLYSDGVM